MMSAVPHRRAPMRFDAEDGPWSVSVAESPHDARAYSLYIKTPTHNLTLTRTAVEIVELDAKLRDAHSTVKLPTLPIDVVTTMHPPPKRKSSFLNTLSRLASPNANKTRRMTSSSTSTASPPLPSPNDASDSSNTFTPSAITATLTTTTNSTSLAAYFTTISNTATLRTTRVWKRFVHVRADDLESVRVERAIKRVRSDLTKHTGMSRQGKDTEDWQEEVPKVPAKDEAVTDEKAEKPAEDSPVAENPKPEPEAPKPEATLDADSSVSEEPTPAPPPPAEAQVSKTETPNRMHRSRSADPEGPGRLSRAFTSSSIMQSNASSQTDIETGYESSISGTRKPKKKRSMSVNPSKKSRKVVIDDFEMMRVLGKGCAGKVLLVRHRSSADLYALKAITKRHVLAHQELQHTLTEQAVLKRMAAESKDPFVVKLWWSFHDKENLFLVMDFHPGGDLATQLARWGRLGRDRCRFYAAEIVEGVEGLHAAGVIYRDLKPENILIGADGHIVLTDFGLSKEFPRLPSAATAPPTPRSGAPAVTPPWMQTDKAGELLAGWPGQPVGHSDSTATFCGTAEYLAPEVIQGLSYSYEVDWWSFGTLLFEMLAGITPFWAGTHAEMYVRVLQDDLHFPDDRAIDQDTKSLLRGLLQRDPTLRISEPRVKRHPYFSMIDWSHVYYKRYIPPYIPPIDPSNKSDTQNFDDTFLDMEPVLDDFEEDEETADEQENAEKSGGAEIVDGDDASSTPAQSRSSSAIGRRNSPPEDPDVDLFDGYSFKGRQSILVEEDTGDDDDEEESSEESETEEEKEEVLAAKDGDLRPDELTPTEETQPTLPLSDSQDPMPRSTTPEASPATLAPDTSLPPLPETPEPPAAAIVDESPLPVEEAPQLPPKEVEPTKSKDIAKEPAPSPKIPAKAVNRAPKPPRREKSGVPALDRYLSDGGDDSALAEHDEEDDEWDFIEAGDGEERNGAKGTTLFARGVVDRYRLAVFRKTSTPTSSRPSSSSRVPSESGNSSHPSQRRGRNYGTFRKHLKPTSPPSSYSSKTSFTARSASVKSFTTGLARLTPSTSDHAPSPSLKSKKSAVSMNAARSLSDQSDAFPQGALSSSEVREKQTDGKRTKRLKKRYKEGAEKVLSLFSPSPRIPHSS